MIVSSIGCSRYIVVESRLGKEGEGKSEESVVSSGEL